MIRAEKSHLVSVAQSHAGMSGKNNEDRFAISAYRSGQQNPIPVLLAVLSDGIGGHRAGEVAAELAVNGISSVVGAGEILDPLALLNLAIQQASSSIYAESLSSPDQHGMGATCVVVLAVGDRLYAATVGDSRLYLIRQGIIRKLSTDHTWIQEALDAGVLDPNQVEGHPNAHVIRRYLGSPNPPQVDFRIRLDDLETDSQAEANQGTPLLTGDYLLLCSDGLSDLVKDHEIQQAVLSQPLPEAVNSLIDLANQRGGHDNITIVLIQVPEKISETKPAAPAKKPKRWMFGCAAVVLLAALIAGLVWGALWLRGKREIPPTFTPTGALTELPERILPSLTPSALPTRFRTPTPEPSFTKTATAPLAVAATLDPGSSDAPQPAAPGNTQATFPFPLPEITLPIPQIRTVISTVIPFIGTFQP